MNSMTGIKDAVTSIHDNLRHHGHHKKKSEASSEVSFETDSKPATRTITVVNIFCFMPDGH